MAEHSRWRMARARRDPRGRVSCPCRLHRRQRGSGGDANGGPVEGPNIPDEKIELTPTVNTASTLRPRSSRAFEAKYPNSHDRKARARAVQRLHQEHPAQDDFGTTRRTSQRSRAGPTSSSPAAISSTSRPYEELYRLGTTPSPRPRSTSGALTRRRPHLRARASSTRCPGPACRSSAPGSNRAQLDQLGVDAPPTTIDELEADLALAKAAGLQGIEVGGARHRCAADAVRAAERAVPD